MKRIVCAVVLLALCAPVRSEARQDNAPSAFDKCRTVTGADIADRNAPTFASYRASALKLPQSPKLDLKSEPFAREYRTVLRRELAKGPNFAGHYRVAAWGCGSSCTMFAVVDLNTGHVITPKGFSHTSGMYFGVDNQKAFPGSQSEYWLLAFSERQQITYCPR